jgi:predicted nucleic acid-binding protein
MRYIYLDSNILIAYYAKDKAEKDKNKMISEALDVFAQSQDAQLCISMWTIAEMANILISNKKMKPGKVAEIESDLINEKRLRDLKIKFVEVSPKSDYDFTEFFYHIRRGILRYHSGVGDIIHSVIMKNNRIKDILTFDEKDDFKQIPDLTVLHPKIIKREK